jgi:hypothetical protein
VSPFNLEAALAGQPVVTRDGILVQQLTLFNASEEFWPVAGVVSGVVELFTLSGKSGPGHTIKPHDLFMA